jgi:L-alanine-DL-glutamate epimerase-like enolase superfamily enzyme
MKIAEVRVDSLILDKHDPEWRTALAADSQSAGWAVSIVADDGSTGYGYGSAMPHYGAPLESVKANLDRFAKLIIGKNPRKIAAILDDLDRSVVGNNQAKSAVDCALHDLLARQLGIPICDLFGGAAVTEIKTLRILPLKTPEKMAANARRLVDQGIRYLKIKIEGNIEEDVASVAAIREEVGKDVHLTVDANQTYSPKGAIAAIHALTPFNIDIVEQPVPSNDLRGLKMVTDAVSVPVEADEAAYSLDQISLIVRERMADAVSLKISKIGGLRKTYVAAKLCEAGGLKYRMGAHYGPGLLNAHGIQLAAALPGIWYPSELGEFVGFIDDPWTGLKMAEGIIRVSDAPGCGLVPRDGKPGH